MALTQSATVDETFQGLTSSSTFRSERLNRITLYSLERNSRGLSGQSSL
jgi:hypothetical protein